MRVPSISSRSCSSSAFETDADTVRATIENYDKAVMAGEQPEGVKKTQPERPDRLCREGRERQLSA